MNWIWQGDDEGWTRRKRRRRRRNSSTGSNFEASYALIISVTIKTERERDRDEDYYLAKGWTRSTSRCQSRWWVETGGMMAAKQKRNNLNEEGIKKRILQTDGWRRSGGSKNKRTGSEWNFKNNYGPHMSHREIWRICCSPSWQSYIRVHVGYIFFIPLANAI